MNEQHGTSDPILVEQVRHRHADVAVITLNRPDQRNPIDRVTLRALRDQLRHFADNAHVRAVVVTGAGTAFSSGGDLKGYRELYRDEEQFRAFLELFDETCALLERSRLLTVAMVNGTCVAGGLELCLACDLVTIAADARIGDGHLRFGQLPGAGGSQRLVRAIGLPRADSGF